MGPQGHDPPHPADEAQVHLVGGLEPVEDDALPDHVELVGHLDEPRAVIEVLQRDMDAPALHGLREGLVPLRLLDGVALVGRVRLGVVAEDPQELPAGELREGLDLVQGLLRAGEPDPAHARIQGNVVGDILPVGSPVGAEGLAVFEGGHRRLDVVAGDGFKIALRRGGQEEDGGLDARLAELHGLVRHGHGEPVRLALQQLRRFHGPVAVGVGLDHRRQEHLIRQMAPGRHKVVEHGAKIDLAPGPQRIVNPHIQNLSSVFSDTVSPRLRIDKAQ